MQCVLETCSIQGFIRESRRVRNLGADSFHENLDTCPVASSGLSCCRPNVRETVKGTARPNNRFNWRRAKLCPIGSVRNAVEVMPCNQLPQMQTTACVSQLHILGMFAGYVKQLFS